MRRALVDNPEWVAWLFPGTFQEFWRPPGETPDVNSRSRLPHGIEIAAALGVASQELSRSVRTTPDAFRACPDTASPDLILE